MSDAAKEKDSEFVPEEEIEEGPMALKRLREKLKKAVAEKQEYLDGWQRARADFVNFKKEEAKREEEKEDRNKAGFVEALLPSLDSFEMALRHNPEMQELRVVHKQLTDALKKLGVRAFGKRGEKFNPHRHEALREVPTTSDEDDHTIETIERSGYSIGDKIIRPAHVTIWVKS